MKSSTKLLLTVAAFMLLSAQFLSGQYNVPSKLKWWYEDRFGMFIHFGSYSYLGHGEWAFSNERWAKGNYQSQVSANFNPSSFNAGTIARLAKKAGMKYLVITAKHHEGFCMWPTEVQSFKDTTGTKLYTLKDFTKFGDRDILMELKDSCDKVGVKFCIYYSILDWNHPTQKLYRNPDNQWDVFSEMSSFEARKSYINDMKTQLKELIDRYHPYIMWFDGDWTYNSGDPTLIKWWTKNDGKDLYDTLVKLDPNLVVNERVFRGAGLGDYECPEQTVPAAPLDRPWETCQTMNTSWGYASWDNNYKTPQALIQQLVDVASKDGNYLLNIGPKGDGTVPAESVNGLNKIGDWMSIYSESIYGTTRSPFSAIPSWGRFTKKNGKLFAHVFTWPQNGILKVPSLTNTINKIYLLNDSSKLLNYKDSAGYIKVTVPTNAPNADNSVIAISVQGIPIASTDFIKVTAISLKTVRTISKIKPGDTISISASITPANSTDKTFKWSLSDNSVASITSDGLLTALKVGKVTVTATANDGSDIQGKIDIVVAYPTALIKEGNDKNVQLFPNPANNGVLNIKQSMGNGIAVDVFNMSGQKLISEKFDGALCLLDVSNLNSGIYTIRISKNEIIVNREIIIR